MTRRGHHDWSSASRGKRQCYICLMWQHFDSGRWEYQIDDLSNSQQEYLYEHERNYNISCDLILALNDIAQEEYDSEREGNESPEHIYLVWDKPSILVRNYRKKIEEAK